MNWSGFFRTARYKWVTLRIQIQQWGVRPRVAKPTNVPGAPDEPVAIIYFGFNQTEVDTAGRRKVRRVARIHLGRRLSIRGFNDDIGPPRYRLGLATQRAKSVANALLDEGIDTNRLEVSASEEGFVADNDSNESRQKNRRVEIRWIDAPVVQLPTRRAMRRPPPGDTDQSSS